MSKQAPTPNPRIAEEKAVLCHQLRRLCLKPPASVVNGSVQLVRRWVDAQSKARALVASPRASINELSSAVSAMQAFER